MRNAPVFRKFMFLCAGWSLLLAFISFYDFVAVYVGESTIFDHELAEDSSKQMISIFWDVISLVCYAILFALVAGNLHFSLRTLLLVFTVCCVIAALGRNSIKLFLLVVLFWPFVLLWQVSSHKAKDGPKPPIPEKRSN